ncbi:MULTISPECIES: P27 family phage terminase small subunit [Listeria]|uniref:P27 family phage terminase small subunit n=1 Tax=Listeria TaxID=1637 RepID=UPI000B58D9FA|nr:MULTISPECIES: P27 family phage terminase small subunit [Listeria]
MADESLVAFESQTIKERVINDMKGLGVYKTEYDNLITIYCDLLAQYDDAQQKFIESNYQYESPTAAGGTKKSAIVATLENLRKDIIAYSDRLCLNPRAIENITTENKKQSSLADILSEMR